MVLKVRLHCYWQRLLTNSCGSPRCTSAAMFDDVLKVLGDCAVLPVRFERRRTLASSVLSLIRHTDLTTQRAKLPRRHVIRRPRMDQSETTRINDYWRRIPSRTRPCPAVWEKSLSRGNKGATHCYAVVDSVDYLVAGQADGQICENRACEIRSCRRTDMARMPRKFVVDDDEVGVYHCINRCVRRALLCGTDEVSGQCFDHRKQFIQDRLEFLAGVFGIDVLAFAVMSNHLHVVLRNRPGVVKSW